MKLSPCKDCEDRVLYCHSTCEKYAEFKKERKAICEAMKKSEHDKYFIQVIFKNKRKDV